MTVATLLTCLASTTCVLVTPTPHPETGQNMVRSPEAVAILAKADTATKAVQVVRYQALARSTGWLRRRIPEVEGTAVIAGNYEAGFRMARIDALIRFPGLENFQKLTYGADGTSYYLIDWDQKLFYEDIDRRVTGQAGRAAQRIGLREFVHPAPFADEIRADSVRVIGQKAIGKEPCDVIDVVYADEGGHAVWYISMRDFLPRRVDRFWRNAAGDVGTFVVELFDLEVNPSIDSEVFKLSPPEGFETSARFAPGVRNIPW